MKTFIIFISIVLAVNALSVEENWKIFKDNSKRQYKSLVEETRRFEIFKDNIRKIEEHNAKYERGEVSYKLAVNKFVDLTEEEFKTRLNPQPTVTAGHSKLFANIDDSDIPNAVDWRPKGAVTRVKDQAECNGCWAFGAAAALEGQYFLKTGKLVAFSEQFLIDCSLWNNGCRGGWTMNAYRDIRDMGMVTEESYPYEGSDLPCRANGTLFKDMGYVAIPQDEEVLKAAVAKIGPIAVSIDASYLYLYGGGVFDNTDCSSTSTNHVVLITGYGTTEDGVDYWDVKNSWGADWGDEGYVKMSRNKNGQCAIHTQPFYPVI